MYETVFMACEMDVQDWRSEVWNLGKLKKKKNIGNSTPEDDK